MEELKLVDKGLWQCWGCENRNKYVDPKRVEPICKINGDTIMNWVFVPCHYFKLMKQEVE